MSRLRKPASPFRCFNSSPEVIRLVVMMYVRFPLSLRNVEDLLFERGIDLCHETVRFWWNRFGSMFASEARRQRVSRMRGFRHWRWHLDEMYVKLNGEMVYLWRAVDQEGEVLESYITKTRDKSAALTFMKKALKGVVRLTETGSLTWPELVYRRPSCGTAHQKYRIKRDFDGPCGRLNHIGKKRCICSDRADATNCGHSHRADDRSRSDAVALLDRSSSGCHKGGNL